MSNLLLIRAERSSELVVEQFKKGSLKLSTTDTHVVFIPLPDREKQNIENLLNPEFYLDKVLNVFTGDWIIFYKNNIKYRINVKKRRLMIVTEMNKRYLISCSLSDSFLNAVEKIASAKISYFVDDLLNGMK